MIAPRRQSRLFTYLDGSEHDPDEVGGKAAGLDLLIAHGYPVPRAAVITTVAYSDAVTERRLQLLVDDLMTASLPAPDRIAAEAAAIERTFLAAPLPSLVETAIKRVGVDVLSEGPVAVRSSATAEDLAEASFAGQYLTITDVTTVDELEVAVRRCWASLWSPAARAYRRRHRVPELGIAMAVIAQQQVAPHWSGVAFTSDPQGREHLIRIEAVPGMGEALVSGKVTPADYLVRKDTLEISSESPEPQPGLIEDLARLALRIESSLGAPQDIEWAYDDTGLWLLQMRPVTTSSIPTGMDDGFDTSHDPAATYTPHGVIEMLPGVVSPLLWTINAPMLENAFRATFADLGGQNPPDDRPIVSRFRGRAALDLSAICDVAASLPGGDPAEVERQYLGRTISETRVEDAGGIHLFSALRSRQAHKRIVDEVQLTAAAAQAISQLDIDIAVLPVRKLVAYRQRVRDLAWRGYTAEVGASSAAGATYRALELLLERWLPEPEAASWAQRLTRGAMQTSAMRGDRNSGLHNVLTNHGTTAIRALLDESPPDLQERIAALDEGKQFLVALEAAVRAMGSKAVYGDTSWSEDDIWIWRQLQTLSGTTGQRISPETGDSFTDLHRHLASARKWRRTRILTGQFVDMRARWLRRQVAETTRFLELREQAKSALLILGGEERRTIVEASERLVASRQLPDADLVGYLTDAELEGMLFGSCGIARDELETRREVARACAVTGPLRDWFNGGPNNLDLREVPTGKRLPGWATSPGRASGTVRVISSLADGVRLEKGDVLVAHATDPSWTPLFLTAGAVVLETGGPLAHAAIVAREFGLPAVLNVPQATRILSDGEQVVVDGTLGFVDREDLVIS
jgi:phosphohistidine swiveling domain-containing protein